jgi:surface polysaccharide O-acyltransferase-like enzyme
MQRNFNLDLLKILACFSVVVLHVTGRVVFVNNNYTLSHFFYYAACIAVPIFFMVNGYLLLNKNEITYKYIWKKISNILIVVFSWNLIILIGKLIIKREFNNPIYSVVENLIQRGYFWQFWFFGSLIIIYLFVPILNKYFKNVKSAVLLTCMFIGISLVIDLISIFRSLNGDSIVQINVIQTFRLWTWLAYYLLGGLLGNTLVKNKILNFFNVKWNWAILISSLTISNIYQYNMAKLYNAVNAEYFYDNILTFVYVISLFILVLRFNFKSLNRFILLISSNMIGIYILHATVIKVLSKLISFDKPLLNTIIIFIVFISSLLCSWIISKIPIVKKLISL